MTFQETVRTQKPAKLEPINEGSFGVQLATYDNGWRAVIKTAKDKHKDTAGRKFFRGIRISTIPKREAAFFSLSQLLGWDDLVPETYLTTKADGDVECSAQAFIPSIHLKDLEPEIGKAETPKQRLNALKSVSRQFPKDEWLRLVILDLIANSRDRHLKNLIVKFPGPSIKLIDNGVSLGLTFSRYRCVFHRYLFKHRFDFSPYAKTLELLTPSRLDVLGIFLRPLEVKHVYKRVRFLLKFPYRIPFSIMSKDNYGINDFPSYAQYFKPERDDGQKLYLKPPPGVKDITDFKFINH